MVYLIFLFKKKKEDTTHVIRKRISYVVININTTWNDVQSFRLRFEIHSRRWKSIVHVT